MLPNPTLYVLNPPGPNSVIFEVRFSIFEGPFRLVSVRFDSNCAVSIRSGKL